MDDNRINRYQIVKTLGEGSFGKVKLAYHLATNSRVALKIINRRTLQKTDMQGRVEREISYLRLLRHRHIIKLYEVIKKKDEIIMVLEFAGKELFDHIVQQGRMSEAEARKFFQQIISAVQYCHRHKIVHRDLKPENLLLDEKMDIKIADFGLSNIMTDGNFLKTSCGSPNYAAPEVISGRLYAGPEVDVWSCGVILYVMLVGRLPFDEESIPELFQRISQGIFTIPDFVSPGARNLLQRMLVVNPLDRITVDEIIKDPWFQVDLRPDLFPESPEQGPVDEGVIRYLSEHLGYSRKDIMEALAPDVPTLEPTQSLSPATHDGANEAVADVEHIGSEPGTPIPVTSGESVQTSPSSKAQTSKAQQIRDAYSLILDSQMAGTDNSLDELMALRTEKRSRSSSTVAGSPARPSAWKPSTFSFDQTHLGSVGTSETTIAVLPQSLPQYHLAYMQSRNVAMSKKRSPTTVKKSKMRWHFGIRSRSYPLDVMGEIYRALEALGAEWTIPSEEDIWTINVRWHNEATAAPDRGAISEVLKMRIQLYQLEQNNYLVDFKFDGFENEKPTDEKHAIDDTFSAYPFLRLATSLIMELAVNSQS